jgi:membrane-associated phospholipid phosphatase
VNDPVTDWNLISANATLTASPALAPVAQARVMAIMQVSVHDAVNAITGEYETYRDRGDAPSGASPEAAAIAAAYHAIKGLFGASSALDALYADSLSDYSIDAADPGLGFGRDVALAVLASRMNDGWSVAQFNYTAPGAGQPGIWERLTSTPALLPGWGAVTPFVLRSSDQFFPEPPPALASEQYAKDYNEILAIGRLNSQTRTQLQTDIALFWRASPVAIWNPMIHQALGANPRNLSETARIFALVWLASADAGIACWEAKYHYNYWRPQPAIVRGAEDGNNDTVADGTWLPLLTTPPHPEYPSGHSSNSGAIAGILALLFGDDPGVQLIVTQTGITRMWDRFSEASDEVVDARVYSGIHFRTADDVGAILGKQVARFVFTHALTPGHGR